MGLIGQKGRKVSVHQGMFGMARGKVTGFSQGGGGGKEKRWAQANNETSPPGAHSKRKDSKTQKREKNRERLGEKNWETRIGQLRTHPLGKGS